MAISFPSLPANWKMPLFWAQMDGSQAGGVSLSNPALLIGQKLAAGSEPINTVIAIGSAAQAGAAFGMGSMLERMIVRFLARTPTAMLYAVAVADPSAGVAATGTITIAGTSTASGIYSLYVAGYLVPVQVLAAATSTQIAASVVAAINALGVLPVSAASALGVVTLTAKWTGATGNDTVITDSYRGTYGGEAMPSGITVVYGAMTGGAGVPDLTGAVTALGDTIYDYVGLPYTDSASMSLMDTEYGFGDTGRWGFVRELYGCVWTARRDTYSNLIAWGPTGNSAVESTMAVETGSPSPIWEWTAVYCACAAAGYNEDPARPLQTLELTGILPAPQGQRFTITMSSALANVGIATQSVAPSGAPQILRETLRYQVNQYGQSDTAYELATTLYTLATIFRTLKSSITSKYARYKVADDGTLFAPGQAIVTPNTVRAELVSEYAGLEFNGLVEDAATFKANLIVSRNTRNPSRLDVLYPPNLVSGLRVFAVLGQFRLQYQPPV